MEDRLIVTASPHIRDASTTRGLMGNVVIALLPAVLAAGLIFGVQALVLVAVTTLACVAFEYIYEKLLKKSNTVGDLSAVVTGIILALNMPVGMPLWIAVVGAFVAIVITKQLFGGLGYNFANPALVGRIVLFLGFTSRMTAYVYPDMAVDALASILRRISTMAKRLWKVNSTGELSDSSNTREIGAAFIVQRAARCSVEPAAVCIWCVGSETNKAFGSPWNVSS